MGVFPQADPQLQMQWQVWDGIPNWGKQENGVSGSALTLCSSCLPQLAAWETPCTWMRAADSGCLWNTQHWEYLMWFAMEYSSIYLQMIEINITNLTPSKDVKQINLPETNFYGRRLIFKWLLQYKLIHNNHLKFWSVLQISTLYNAMSMKSLYNIPLECCIFLMHSWYFQEIIFTVINNCWFTQNN